MFITVYFLFIEFLLKFFFQNDDQLLIKFHEILTVFCLHEHLQRKSTFFISKNFFIPPEKVLVCVWGEGLKTETGKFHEILTSVCGGLKTFLYPQKNFSVCGGGSEN